MPSQSRDAFDTPPAVAEKMVRAATSRLPNIVADFSAGAGALLEAAESRWPDATFVACDIDAAKVQALRRLHPGWVGISADFLDLPAAREPEALRKLRGAVSLILLNPPFSCRGAARVAVNAFGSQVQCSKAMAFVLQAATFLGRRGEIVALLPTGCLTSEKDKAAWLLVRHRFRVSVLGTNGHRTFSGCSPKTTLVRLRAGLTRNGRSPDYFRMRNRIRCNGLAVDLTRGGHPLFEVSPSRAKSAVPLIHTTNLRFGRVCPPFLRVLTTRKVVTPGVLLPRVGTPSLDKIAVVGSRGSWALSDCVIALECRSARSARIVKKRLEQNWNVIQRLYGGTCARYVTLRNLSRGLHAIGVRNAVGNCGGSPKRRPE